MSRYTNHNYLISFPPETKPRFNFIGQLHTSLIVSGECLMIILYTRIIYYLNSKFIIGM